MSQAGRLGSSAGSSLYRAGSSALSYGRGVASSLGRNTANWWRNMRSPRGWGGGEWTGRDSTGRLVRLNTFNRSQTGGQSAGTAARGGVGAAGRGQPAGSGLSSPAGTGYRYRYPSGPFSIGYSSGGIVQPAYLSNGGGAWQFQDLASGYFDYNALNTDPLAYSYDSPFSKYASPREKSYDRIAQGFSGLGMGNFAASRGLGLDAAGRINFESQYGYSDPRSDERDFQTIFGYNRYPSFLAGGGLAKGTDKYPAMLSRGEMVMNAEATRRNAGILRAMNKSSGGMVNNGILYAAGGTDGPIGMSGGTTGGGLGVVLGGAAELSQSMNSFMSVSDFVAGSFNNLSNSLSLFTQMDFGVLNEGATMMQTASSIFRSAASSLNTPLSGFGQSVQSFVSQTSNLISAIARIGDVNGTINVTGRIDIPPIQVNVVGAEIVQRIVPDIESRIMSSIATSLANDYPGLDLSVGSPI